MISRRKLLGIAVVAPLAAACSRLKHWIPKLEEEWGVGFIGVKEELTVKLWRGGRWSVHKGSEQLRLTECTTGGWRKFVGKHGTCIRFRRPEPKQLEVEYVAIVEPLDLNSWKETKATSGPWMPDPLHLSST